MPKQSLAGFDEPLLNNICKSQELSQFTTVFIETEAKLSTIKSLFGLKGPLKHVKMLQIPRETGKESLLHPKDFKKIPPLKVFCTEKKVRKLFFCRNFLSFFFNDPYAGSPTKTLLRLLLPTEKGVQRIFSRKLIFPNLSISLLSPIGRSDGRCVQKAGT